MRKREYLKHKWWKNLDNIEEYNLPKRLSMRQSSKYGNSNYVGYTYHNAFQSKKWKSISHKVYRFIEANIGRSFNKVFSEFKQKFPKYFGDVSLEECFKGRFQEYQNRHWLQQHWSFYIDKFGIIRDAWKEWKEPKNKKRKINIRSSKTLYSFKSFTDGRILPILETYLPKKYFIYLDPEIKFDESTKESIVNGLTTNKMFLVELANLHPISWWRKNYHLYMLSTVYTHFDIFKHDWIYRHNALTLTTAENFIFNKYIIEDCDVVDVDSPEFKRNFEDSRKKKESQERTNIKQDEQYRESLLHTLESERKAKQKIEEQKDAITRDRLGFDESSFRGESYYGQET